MASWTCISCGNQNPAGTRFCGHCGTPLSGASPAAPDDLVDAETTLRKFVAAPVADLLVESGGRLAGERRLITALFADISGFTSLAERVDTEELLEVIDPILARLSAIVGRYEGYVEKFAGDALLALFGAPIAHEDDAVRALHTGLEMQREIARFRDELPASAGGLTLHVGINSGHGIARVMGGGTRLDYGVLGDAVILAQRLESAAPAGEIYVGETTQSLARGRFEFASVGDLTLKGIERNVPTWRLVGERAASSDVRSSDPHAIVGRDRELRALDGSLDGLLGGAGGMVEIEGEPGVGKSAIVEVLRDRATSRGVRWLESRCLSYGSSIAYRPIAELLRSFAGLHLDDLPADVGPSLERALDAVGLADLLPYFARLLGASTTSATGAASWAAVAALEPEAFQRGLHDALGRWVTTLAAASALVLLVEDVHWADTSSMALLEELAAPERAGRYLLVVTRRPGHDLRMEALRAAAEGRSETLSLSPLDRGSMEALVASRLDGAVPPRGLVDLLNDRTGGNPFFVEEVVRVLLETGVLRRSEGEWLVNDGWDASAVPVTIEGVLSARIDRLPAHARSVLQASAVIGRRIRDGLLRGVLAAEADLDRSIDVLVEARLLERIDDAGAPLLAFHHALVQDVAYGRMLRRQRRDLHRRVAEVAEGLYGSGDDYIDLLARHLYLADAGAKSIDYLVRAADRARRLFANAEAIVDFQRAADVAGRLAAADPAVANRLATIRLDLADLQELTGEYESALAAYEQVAEATGDARAWHGVAAVLRKRGRYGEALATLDRAFAGLAASGQDLRGLWLERGWTLSLEGRLSDSRAALVAGLAASEVVDPLRGRLLVQLARGEIVAGSAADGLAHADEASALFRFSDDPLGLAISDRIAGDALRKIGRVDEARERLLAGLATAERIGSSEELGASLLNLGMVEVDTGRYGGATEAFERAATEFRRSGNLNGVVFAESALADALVRAGEPDAGRTLAERTLGVAREIGNEPVAADVLDTLAQAAAAVGDARSAAERYDEASGAYEAVEEWELAAAKASLAADAWEAIGEMERARDRRSRARVIEERVPTVQP